MSARGRSTKAGSSAGLRNAKGKEVQRDVADDLGDGSMGEEERVERERARWVQERQTELGKVSDRHDTYLREAFHLEKFITLLHYDPKTAKEDKTTVWLEYKGQHDLVEESNTAGSSRLTRRARTERLQALKAAPPPEVGRRRKKESDHDGAPSFLPTLAAPNSAPIRSKVSRGMLPAQTPASISAYGNGKGKGKARAVEGIPSSSGRTSKNKSATHAEDVPPPAKRRRLEPKPSLFSAVTESIPDATDRPPESIFAVLQGRRKSRKWQLSPIDPTTSASPSDTNAVGNLASPTKSGVKRIKLIVRRPDPEYSNPRQKPPPPRFGSSLSALMASYTVLDGNDVNEDAVQVRIKQATEFWARVDALRKEGRFFPDSVGDESLHASPPQTGSVSWTSSDPWTQVVDAVRASTLHHPANGRQVATQVANRVRAYWESKAMKDDKLKAQEEKRLRALAKVTIKHVIDEWKRAVHHIRKEGQLKQEEEDRIRGQEHLDAILDQSGQILSTQQLDLSRAAPRSRSSSVSATLLRWASASPDPDDRSSTVEQEDAANDEPEESGGSGDEVLEGIDSSLLLGPGDGSAHRSSSWRSGPSSIAACTSENTSVRHSPEHALHPGSESMSVDEDAPHALIPPSPNTTPPIEHPLSHTNPEIPLPASSFPEKQSVVVDIHLSPEHLHRPVSVDMVAPIPPSTVCLNGTVTATGDDLQDRAESLQLVNGSPVDEMDLNGSTPAPDTVDDMTRLPAMVTHGSDVETPLTMTGAQDVAVSQDIQGIPDISPDEVTILPDQQEADDSEAEEDNSSIPIYLRPYAVAPVGWDPQSQVKDPFLLRGSLRPYQQAGLEWLASLHMNNLNGILADEMGLGKTIQTISLLAHLACDRGIWGPHLIIVPTSVLLNWEMEFKKFLPGFKVLSYHGNTKRRKELRQGWNNKYHFNVCVTSYTLASRDAHVFKRKAWYYMILDEAHMIKNFRSQRWSILLMFRSFRRLLLTGTPLQNNLTELWALLQFLMSGTNFANLKEFGEWFSNPLEKAIEMGNIDEETQQRVSKLHMVLRPYLLRRLKRDVEKELPQKFEHLVMCSLSKRQRFLYDEFMARADTRHDLQSGVYQKIANILMQLRKVVNHPDLFEVRPIVTSFAMQRSAIADFEVKEFLVRRRLLASSDEDRLNFGLLGLEFIQRQDTSLIAAVETRRLDGTPRLPMISEVPGEPPPYDTRTIAGYRRYREWLQRATEIARWTHFGYLNRLRCSAQPIYSQELMHAARQLRQPLLPLTFVDLRSWTVPRKLYSTVKSFTSRAEEMAGTIDRFAFVTPAVVARDLPAIALSGHEQAVLESQQVPEFDTALHRTAVKLQIAFPEPSLLQYDCGKLQELAKLLRERKAGGHRILIFTQMTRVLDILEIFLNFHGYLYLRLDGATKIEDRQYITERFNSDSRIFCFISSSRSGGVGINLTGADTVIFYDSDFNPQMDRQCEDRAHRIGQIRDVHIYRFVSSHTVEEALLRKANQKRTLDNLVIQKGEFDWRSLFSNEEEKELTKALGEVEDEADALAAAVAAREEVALIGEDEKDFGEEGTGEDKGQKRVAFEDTPVEEELPAEEAVEEEQEAGDEEEEEGGTTVDYMLAFVRSDMDYFADWRL